MNDSLQVRKVSVKRRDAVVQKHFTEVVDAAEVVGPKEDPPLIDDSPPLVQNQTMAVEAAPVIEAKPGLPDDEMPFFLTKRK